MGRGSRRASKKDETKSEGPVRGGLDIYEVAAQVPQWWTLSVYLY